MYAWSRDAIDLSTDDPQLLELADHLWRRETGGAWSTATARERSPIRLDLRVAHRAPGPRSDRSTESWTVTPWAAVLRLGDELAVTADVPSGAIIGWVSAALLARDPGLVARLLLEVPVAALLERRGYAAVHAAAVAGPRGAVVLRGGPGSGKSTLATAAYLAGLEILGDESVLVERDHPDELLAAVRDPTLEPDAIRLLEIPRTERLVAATERAGAKQRLDLFRTSSAPRRSQHRVATIILGNRSGGPARLQPLDPGTFVDAFRTGAIPEERWGEPAPNIEMHWSRNGALRLSGAEDLRGAVALLAELVGHVPHRGSRV